MYCFRSLFKTTHFSSRVVTNFRRKQTASYTTMSKKFEDGPIKLDFGKFVNLNSIRCFWAFLFHAQGFTLCKESFQGIITQVELTVEPSNHKTSHRCFETNALLKFNTEFELKKNNRQSLYFNHLKKIMIFLSLVYNNILSSILK